MHICPGRRQEEATAKLTAAEVALAAAGVGNGMGSASFEGEQAPRDGTAFHGVQRQWAACG